MKETYSSGKNINRCSGGHEWRDSLSSAKEVRFSDGEKAMQLTEPGAELDILEVLSDCHLSDRPGAPVGAADTVGEVLLLTESGSVYYIRRGKMLNMKNGEYSDQGATILKRGYRGDGVLTIGKPFMLPDRTTSPVMAACCNFESTAMGGEPVDPDALKNPFPVCRSAMERARDAAAEA